MDHHQEGVGVTAVKGAGGNDEVENEGGLNGHSSRSSSLSSSVSNGEEYDVQNVAQSSSKTGGDHTDSGCTTVDTLTSSESCSSSNVVCRPEPDHQDVVHEPALLNLKVEPDKNQSTIQSQTEKEQEQQQHHRQQTCSSSSTSQPSSNSRRFSTAEQHEREEPYFSPSTFLLPSKQQEQTNSSNNNSRLLPEKVKEPTELKRDEETEREKEVNKLREDLKRLRIHLIQVEDGYTQELVESSQREEQLVAKLAAAEERIKWQEERIKESSDALKAAGRLVTSIDDKESAIKKLRDEIARKTEEVATLNKRINELEESCENKLDKQLVKSLMINYFTSPPELKKDVARLLVRILDFSEQELIKSGLMNTGPSVQEGAAQVASQFVQFLERESVPRHNPQVPTIVTPSPALSKTPSTSSLAMSTPGQPSTSRTSFIGPSAAPTGSSSVTGTPNVQTSSANNSMVSTSGGSIYKPAGPEAVRQLAKGLLNSSGNPFTNP